MRAILYCTDRYVDKNLAPDNFDLLTIVVISLGNLEMVLKVQSLPCSIFEMLGSSKSFFDHVQMVNVMHDNKDTDKSCVLSQVAWYDELRSKDD